MNSYSEGESASRKGMTGWCSSPLVLGHVRAGVDRWNDAKARGRGEGGQRVAAAKDDGGG